MLGSVRAVGQPGRSAVRFSEVGSLVELWPECVQWFGEEVSNSQNPPPTSRQAATATIKRSPYLPLTEEARKT